MEVDVVNFSTYEAMFDMKKPFLIGTQTIYSIELQSILIPVFWDTLKVFNSQNNEHVFCFSINNIVVHPTMTCDICPKNMIVVSDEIFEQYFEYY